MSDPTTIVFIIYNILSILSGLIVTVTGRFYVIGSYKIRGRRARLIGLCLAAPLPLYILLLIITTIIVLLTGTYSNSHSNNVALINLILFVKFISWGGPLVAAFYLLLTTPPSENERIERTEGQPLTVAQAALRLGKPESEVLSAIEGRKLLARRVNGEWRIDEKILQAYLAAHQPASDAPKPDLSAADKQKSAASRQEAESVSFYLARGRAFHKLGEFSSAAADFQRVLALDPFFAQAETLETYIKRYGTTFGTDGEAAHDLAGAPIDWYGTSAKPKQKPSNTSKPNQPFWRSSAFAVLIGLPLAAMGVFAMWLVFGGPSGATLVIPDTPTPKLALADYPTRGPSSTPTITYTPSITPTRPTRLPMSTLIASPATDIPVTSSPMAGQVVVHLYSAPSDPVGHGIGDFTLQGPGRFGTDQNAMNFRVVQSTQSNISWTFVFYAPQLIVGQSYENAVQFPANDKQFPGMSIKSTDPSSSPCFNNMQGHFIIEQLSPAIVVSFRQTCYSNTAVALEGTLTFTPNVLEATPTPHPNYGQPVSFPLSTMRGSLTAEIQTSSDEPNAGTRTIHDQGSTNLTFNGHNMSFLIDRASGAEHWSFVFNAFDWQIGKIYRMGQLGISSDQQAWVDVKPPNDGTLTCVFSKGDYGSFSVEQQAPSLIVAFEETCQGEDYYRTFKGRLTLTDFIPTLTPSPAMITERPTLSTPVPMNIQQWSGQFIVTLYGTKAGNNAIEPGSNFTLGNFTIGGSMSVSVKDNAIILNGQDKVGNSGAWQFEFFAPDLQMGRRYEKATLFWPSPGRKTPEIAVNWTDASCTIKDGQFFVQQLTPKLIISFKMNCGYPNYVLQGTIIVTPDLVPPTPVVTHTVTPPPSKPQPVTATPAKK